MTDPEHSHKHMFLLLEKNNGIYCGNNASKNLNLLISEAEVYQNKNQDRGTLGKKAIIVTTTGRVIYFEGREIDDPKDIPFLSSNGSIVDSDAPYTLMKQTTTNYWVGYRASMNLSEIKIALSDLYFTATGEFIAKSEDHFIANKYGDRVNITDDSSKLCKTPPIIDEAGISKHYSKLNLSTVNMAIDKFFPSKERKS